MKQEDKLKEAFSSVAMEQTEQLEKSLTYEERRKSEALYKHHHDTALRLLRKQKVSIVKWVSGIAAVAAAVLLIACSGYHNASNSACQHCGVRLHE